MSDVPGVKSSQENCPESDALTSNLINKEKATRKFSICVAEIGWLRNPFQRLDLIMYDVVLLKFQKNGRIVMIPVSLNSPLLMPGIGLSEQ